MSKQKTKNNLRTQHVLTEMRIFCHIMGYIVDARISASEKDLPVLFIIHSFKNFRDNPLFVYFSGIC